MSTELSTAHASHIRAPGRAAAGSWKLGLCTLALLAASPNALAQQVPGPGGQGGGLLQQIPPPPALQQSIPEIRIQRGEVPSNLAPGGITILVNSLHITGETKFSEAELIAATGFRPGELDLAGLRTLAARITDYYNSRGYFLAQAYLPAQDITGGAVTIAVIEGRYGQISLRNSTNLSNALANNILEGLNSGDVIAIGPLERRLLLLSDIPGVQINSTLTPGAAVGTSDLIVEVTPGQRVTASIEGDNEGNYYTGEYRVSGTVNLNDPLGIGDVLSLRALASTTGGLYYGRASYQAQIDKLTVGVSYASLLYRLGKNFAALDARGYANIASVYASYPLIRSRNDNLYALASANYEMFHDTIGATSTVTNKDADTGTVGIAGNHHDTLGGGGADSYSLNYTFGKLDIQTDAARALDLATARSNGGYGKLTYEADRLQTLTGPWSLFGEVRGQIASKNLDEYEKMELGGAYGVRAYPEGEAYGDEGYILTGEIRLALPNFVPRLPGQMQLAAFVDTGSVTLDKNPWVAGPNTRTLSGAGIGFTWSATNNFFLTAFYAHRLGNAPITAAPDHNWGIVGVQLSKFF